MQVRTATIQDVTVLEVEGRVDSNTAAALEEHLLGAVAAPQCRLIVDFSSTPYLTSAGLRVLALAAEHVERTRGKLILHGLNERVREVFEISGFDSVLNICTTRTAALDAARA